MVSDPVHRENDEHGARDFSLTRKLIAARDLETKLRRFTFYCAERAIRLAEATLLNNRNVRFLFLYLLEIEDDSMEPTLKRGELVLADASGERGERNGVYAIGFRSKELLAKPERADQPTVRFVVRRVQHHLDHKSLTISCDNRAYASETHTWTREEGRVREGVVVLPWVFWHGSFL